MTSDSQTGSSRQPYWNILLATITGKPLPPVLDQALRGVVQPLKIGIRTDFTAFMAANSYAPEQVSAIHMAVGVLVRSNTYQTALACEGSMRIDLDGNATGPVSADDRLSAEIALLTNEIRRATQSLMTMCGRLEEIEASAKSATPATQGKPTLSLPKLGIAKVQAKQLGTKLEHAGTRVIDARRSR